MFALLASNREPGTRNPSLVTVVIPTFNRGGFLEEAAASVLSQSYSELELLVVDDGSTDGSAEHLRDRFPDPRLRVIRQENLGASAARNRGAAEALGEWLAFLDSDDSWLPEKLELQLAALAERPECPACYTEEVWYRRGVWANPRSVHAKHSGWIFRHCLRLCIISPSSILLRRDAFEALGGFDESLPACEDYDLWLRLSARHPIHLLPERLIVKRNGHPGQLSQEHWGLDRFRIRALWKLAFDLSLAWDLRRQALDEISRRAGVVAGGAAKRGQEERARTFQHSQEAALRWIEQVGSSSA